MDSRISKAIARGVRRGVQMSINPDPTRLRELRAAAQARSSRREELAWARVGQTITDAMGEVSATIGQSTQK